MVHRYLETEQAKIQMQTEILSEAHHPRYNPDLAPAAASRPVPGRKSSSFPASGGGGGSKGATLKTRMLSFAPRSSSRPNSPAVGGAGSPLASPLASPKLAAPAFPPAPE